MHFTYYMIVCGCTKFNLSNDHGNEVQTIHRKFGNALCKNDVRSEIYKNDIHGSAREVFWAYITISLIWDIFGILRQLQTQTLDHVVVVHILI